MDNAVKRIAIAQPQDLSHFEHNLWDCLPYDFDLREYLLPPYYKLLREMGITAITQSLAWFKTGRFRVTQSGG